MIRALRDGDWMHGERLRAYGLGYLLVALLSFFTRVSIAAPAAGVLLALVVRRLRAGNNAAA